MITTEALVLVLAISIDSFLAGLSYGCAGIRVPLKSLAIPGIITGLVFFSSMNAGSAIAALLSVALARWIGGAMLVVIGAYALSNGNGDATHVSLAPQSAACPIVALNFMGLILHVIRDSRAADLDRSSAIDAGEATVLGIALAMDAFGVGLSAALAGFPVWSMTLLASVITPLSMALGTVVGRISHIPNTSLVRKLPSWTLVGIGLLRLI